MTRGRAGSITLMIVGIAIAPAVSAGAQTGSGPRPLFREAPSDPNARPASNVALSFFPGVPDSELNTRLAYSKQRDRLTMSVAGALTARHQREAEDFMAATRSASGGVLFEMNSRTTVQVKGGGSVAPYFALAPLANVSNTALTISPVQDSQYAALSSEVRSSDAEAEVARDLGRRGRMTAAFGSRQSISSDQTLDFGEHSATSAVSRRIGRSASLQLAYRYRASSFGAPAARTLRSHDVRIGFARAWRHSSIRSTSVAVAGGPTLAGERTHPSPVFGRVDVTHHVGAMWRATGSYRREVETIVGFGDGALSNTVSAGVSRLLGRRLELDVAAVVSRGHIGVASVDNGYHTYTGSTRLRFALTPRLAVSAEYLLYRHRFGDGALLPDGFDRQLDSRGPRLGLAFWIPLRAAGASE